jgi:outer membrane lipoprotein-sorting protein
VVDGAPTENQARFFRWVEMEGRLVPTIIDYYRDGKQTARISIDSFSFNTTIPEKLFAKPSDVKEIK